MTTPPVAGTPPPSPDVAPAPAASSPTPGPPAAGAEPDKGGGPASESPSGSHTVGSGDDANTATSRYGEASRRREYLRHAEHGVVEGDAVGGDKNVFLVGGEKKARLRRLPPPKVEAIRHAFVDPEGWANIRVTFGKSRAIILRGAAGCGKEGASVRLLLNRGLIFQLDRKVDLTRLAEFIETDVEGRDRIEQGAGFVLDQPADFANLYGSVLQGLEDALERADARLVLTVGSDVPVPDHDLLDYIVDLPATAKYEEITIKHLRYLLDDYRTERLLARADIREEISQQLVTDPSCKLAVDLATAIADEADATDGGDLDVEKIRARMSQRGADAFDVWFAGIRDLPSRCFAIALAVLDGLPFEAVATGARALHKRFETRRYLVMSAEGDAPPDARSPFRVSRRERLRRLRAHTTSISLHGPYGQSRAEAVEYTDPEYAVAVLRQAWSEYEIQDTLLHWLGELAEDGTEQVRIYAGTALGHLATWSFDYLTFNVLRPWASSESPALRDAVAYALRIPATDPKLKENVRRLIASWYANREDPLAQATAARAYGVAWAPIDTAKAADALDRLCVVDDIRVAAAIGDSLADLLAEGPDLLARSVLPKLVDSLGEPKRAAVVQLVFLILSSSLLIDVPAGERTVSWPYLLYLASRLTEVRSALVALWRYVLNDALFHDEAEKVLTVWAFSAEGESELREVFLRLARAIARGQQRARLIMERYAAEWVSVENLNPLPVVSAALLAILAAESGAA